jgi:hypothetical protein
MPLAEASFLYSQSSHMGTQTPEGSLGVHVQKNAVLEYA